MLHILNNYFGYLVLSASQRTRASKLQLLTGKHLEKQKLKKKFQQSLLLGDQSQTGAKSLRIVLVYIQKSENTHGDPFKKS